MDKDTLFRLVLKFVTLALLVACLCVFSSPKNPNILTARAQSKQRMVGKEFSRNDVIEFSEVKSNSRHVNLGEGFDDEDDWVKNLALKITNKSAKPITYLNIGLDFLEKPATGNILKN